MPQVIKKPLSETWDKFYSVYMFREIEYHKLCKEKPTVNRDELRRQCYVLDDDGKKIHLGDEKHIFRIQDLMLIQSLLANHCKELRTQINYWEKDCSVAINTEYFTLYYERWDVGTYEWSDPLEPFKKNKEKPKEEKIQMSLFDTSTEDTNTFKIKDAWDYYAVDINNTQQLSIKDRVLLHLEVLRLCRQGLSLENACKKVMKKLSAQQ